MALTLGALSTAVCLASSINLIRATTYRAIGRSVRHGATLFWWLSVVLAWLCSVSGLVVSVAALSVPSAFGPMGSLLLLKATALTSSGLGLVCSIGASASVPPLITTARSPHFFQAHASQLTWTVAAISTSVSALSLALSPNASADMADVLIPTEFALVGALFAWHARALFNLRELRKHVSEAILEALERMRRADEDEATVAALKRLHLAMSPGPFRSQSPAAPPFAAGWEVVEIIGVALHAYGDAALPDNIKKREVLDDGLGDPFVAVVNAKRTDLREATERFFAEMLERLIWAPSPPPEHLTRRAA